MADLKLIADSGGGTVSLKAPATTTSNAAVTLKLPVADGSANQLLKTDGSGQLGWATDGTTDSTKMPLAGGTFSGDTLYNDSVKAKFGTSSDLQLHHTSNVNYVDNAGTTNLEIRSNGGSEYMASFKADSSVDLYYNSSKKFETEPKGIIVNGGGSGEGLVQIIGANSSSSTIEFGDTDDDDVAQIWYDHYGKNLYFRTSEDAGMSWHVNGSERLRLNSAGWLKAWGTSSTIIGASNSYHELNADTAHNLTLGTRHKSSQGYGIQTQLAHSGSGHYHYLAYDYVNDVIRCVIRGDGDLENSNNSYGQYSDIKLKENVVDANSQWDDIKALRVRNFNFKASTGQSTHKQLGLVAQETELVCPNLVKEMPDLEYDNENKDLGTTTKAIKYSVLYMKAIKALQEAMAKIETLETKVAALGG